MELTDIITGTNVWLEIKGLIENGNPLSLKTKFIESENNQIFYIERPIYKGSFFPFHSNSVISLYIVNQDRLYSFTGTFIDYVEENGYKKVKIKASSKLHEIQRRNYFRLKYLMPIQIAIISQNNNEKETQKSMIMCSVSDISGGGIRATTEEVIKRGDKVECYLELLGEKIIIQGDIVWQNPNNDKESKKFDIGIKFDFIESKIRETIIRFIFEQQRKMMNRERK